MQLQLPFGPIVNKEFLSNHWLDHRLPLEPEWSELRAAGINAAEKLIALWKKEKSRAPLYGDEAGLEEKFIQPVFEILGWHTKYQTVLQGREPDYALFVSDESLNEALMKGRNNPDFWLHAAVVADAKAWHVSLDLPQRVGSKREYPPEQIEWYLDRSRCDFGILTNGHTWGLDHRFLNTKPISAEPRGVENDGRIVMTEGPRRSAADVGSRRGRGVARPWRRPRDDATMPVAP